MNILMTGATGLVGRRLGQVLAEQGHQIVALSRQGEASRLQIPFPCRVYAWDGASALDPHILTGVDAVIHLAGESVAAARWTDRQKKRIYKSRIESTRRLHQAFQQSQIHLKAFISASAVGYYGDATDAVLTESGSNGCDFLASVCVDWEKAVWDTHDISDRQVALRTGVVFSPSGGALEPLLSLFQSGFAGPLGSGQQWMSWIHLEDLVQMYVWALNHAVQGPVNAVAPTPVTNREFTKVLGHLLGQPTLLTVPKLALHVVLGEMSHVLLASQRVTPEVALNQGFQFQFADLESALRDVAAAQIDGDHLLLAEQWVARPPAELFHFFSLETNLETLTPPFLNFKVMGKSTSDIRDGTLIDYTLKLHGIPFKWQTRIEAWEPNRQFIDVQLKGPYTKWHHTHQFIPLAGGTLMRDRVLYRLPMGALGRLTASRKVTRDVQRIFAFRRQKIGELYP